MKLQLIISINDASIVINIMEIICPFDTEKLNNY